MISKQVAAVFLIAAAGSSTTLHDSHASFRQALNACGTAALGSISFSLGHARIAGSPGVDTDESQGPGGTISVVLENADGTKSAKVTVNQTNRSVSAKNVRVEMNGSVACILPD